MGEGSRDLFFAIAIISSTDIWASCFEFSLFWLGN